MSAEHSLVGQSSLYATGVEIAKSLPWKRPFDLLLGGLALVISLPVLLLLMLVVRLDSPGPVIFAQVRVGRRGRPFTIWKLRTMRHGAGDDLHRAAAAAWFREEGGPSGYKPDHDPRVTRAGRSLRRTSLDELPQLLNVLNGDMSLVGPRPAIPYELAHYEPWYFERQAVAPGMTGLWQVSGRRGLGAPAMMAWDVRYVREASPMLDLRILLETAISVLGRLAGRTDGWH